MYRFLGVSLLVVVLGLAGAGMASAQGFGVYEQGACMMGRGGAGVADPCPDGSGIFFNPAGLSFDAKVITLGGTMIGPSGTFTDTSTTSMKGTISTLNEKWYPVPNIYMTLPFAKKYAFGVGVFAPYGLTTDWPVTSQGRYLGYKSVVQGLYIQPTFAVKINDKVSLGVGVDVTHLNVELRPARGPVDPAARHHWADLRTTQSPLPGVRLRHGATGHRFRRHSAEGQHLELWLPRRRAVQGERPVLDWHAVPGRPEGRRLGWRDCDDPDLGARREGPRGRTRRDRVHPGRHGSGSRSLLPAGR